MLLTQAEHKLSGRKEQRPPRQELLPVLPRPKSGHDCSPKARIVCKTAQMRQNRANKSGAFGVPRQHGTDERPRGRGWAGFHFSPVLPVQSPIPQMHPCSDTATLQHVLAPASVLSRSNFKFGLFFISAAICIVQIVDRLTTVVRCERTYDLGRRPALSWRAHGAGK